MVDGLSVGGGRYNLSIIEAEATSPLKTPDF